MLSKLSRVSIGRPSYLELELTSTACRRSRKYAFTIDITCKSRVHKCTRIMQSVIYHLRSRTHCNQKCVSWNACGFPFSLPSRRDNRSSRIRIPDSSLSAACTYHGTWWRLPLDPLDNTAASAVKDARCRINNPIRVLWCSRFDEDCRRLPPCHREVDYRTSIVTLAGVGVLREIGRNVRFLLLAQCTSKYT